MLYEATTGSVGERRLEELGLDVATIHEVLLYGNAEAATYTGFDAPAGAEFARWSREIRRLSELKCPEGWERINPDNQPTLVHPSHAWSLVVTSGDAATGLPYATPSTKNPKGRSIQAAVRSNALVLLTMEDVSPVLAGLRQTWMLLTYVDGTSGQIRSEVSWPTEIEGERITKWRDRILIAPLDPTGGATTGNTEEPPDYGFDVVRK